MDCIKHRHGSVIPNDDIEAVYTLKSWNSKTTPNESSIRNIDVVPVYTITAPEEESKKVKEWHDIEVREALRAFEKSRCCSTRLTDEMDIKTITMSEGYIYKAHALMEYRYIEFVSEPYEPEMIIDGPENGTASSMWNISVNPPTDFSYESMQDALIIDEIPHTASKADCETCHKKGYLECDRTGTKKFSVCHGNDFYALECDDCEGSGFMKNYQEITVFWVVLSEKNYYCVLPEKQVKKVKGNESVYHSDDCELKNNPLSRHSDKGVSEISESALQKFQMEIGENDDEQGRRIIRVQQIVTTISIAEVTGMYKGKLETFFVFGNEQKVFFPNGYPAACSCCCSIM